MARSPRLRGIAVLVAAGVLVTGSALVAGAARSAPALPAVTPAALMARTLRAAAADPAVSGEVAVHVDLGLPDLGDLGATAGGGAAAVLSSLSGDHRVRVWNSADGVRVSDLLPAGERSVIVSRSAAWLWDSASMTAVHLHAPPGGSGSPGPAVPPASFDPLQLARQALAAVAPSTKVFVSGTTTVAGRDAYVFRIEPRTSATLIGHVDLYMDAARWVPLGGAVYARGAGSPALSARFTSVSFGPIDPAVYAFTPPPGARVITPPARRPAPPQMGMANGCLPVLAGCGHGTASSRAALIAGRRSPVRVIGSGWSAVAAVRVDSIQSLRAALSGTGLDPASLLPFSGPLFSARLATRGGVTWLLAGAVPQAALERAAAELP